MQCSVPHGSPGNNVGNSKVKWQHELAKNVDNA